jgi:hypothetical protein
MLNVIMLNVIMLSVIMLNVVMLSVVMPSVLAPSNAIKLFTSAIYECRIKLESLPLGGISLVLYLQVRLNLPE